MSSPVVEAALDLATVLGRWGSQPADEPDRVSAVAGVVAALADAGIELASIVAAGPLQTIPGGGPAASSTTNASGDASKPLDVQAEALFVAALAGHDVAAVCSEESTDPIPVTRGGSLVVALDPIDGSSNIDINAPIGTIFSVLPATGYESDAVAALLQPGRRQLAAGLIIFGPSTVLVLTLGDGTDVYVHDRSTNTFVRVQRRIQLPPDSQEFAINASNARHWGPGIQTYVKDLVSGSLGPRERDFNMRWLAALVAETYRILLRGGIYLYPGDARPGYADGRLRLVYEANPVAFLCEQAGGAATDGVDAILDRQPTALHQRTPLVFGSRNKVERVRRYLTDPQTTHEESPLFSSRGLFRA